MKIAIIGCGFVGIELARKLKEKKHFITATTLKEKKLKDLKNVANKAFILNSKDVELINQIVKENEVIIFSISTNSLKEISSSYLDTILAFKSAIFKNKTRKRIIYLSRTKIYGDHLGKWVDEDAKLLGNDIESKLLKEMENSILFLLNMDCQITIFRCANIYGPNRDLKLFFENIYKDKVIENKNYYINMVHRDDVVDAILYSLEKNILGIFNLCDEEHFKRYEFIEIFTKKLNLEPMKYIEKASLKDYNKRVSNYRIKEKGFILKYPKKDLSNIG